MKISVIIPTYNRVDKLDQCLKALSQQSIPASDFEVVVVNDGSTDTTKEYLAAVQVPFQLTAIHQKNQGQATARNAGVAVAKGHVVLLIGDDIVPTPRLLESHLHHHQAYPQESHAVLGFVTWLPTLPVTDLMRFMEKGKVFLGRFGGHQFAYDLLAGKEKADYRFFYTANISLKRALLLQYPFDESFHGYGWEDIELGLRLSSEAGLVLWYAPEAQAHHDHMIDEKAFCSRMEAIGKAMPIMEQRFPGAGFGLSRGKKLFFQLFASSFSRALLKHLHRDLYFYALSRKHLLKGLNSCYN